jgi:hypothetical protein
MLISPNEEIQVTRGEIKKISREFRVIAGQLLGTQHEDGMNNLKRFLGFIERNPLIYDFILKNQVKQYDIPAMIRKLGEWSGGRYEIPDTKEEEISHTYQLLKWGLENFERYWDFPATVGGYTSSGGKIQTSVAEFNKAVVASFVHQIEGYLANLLIDLGDDDQNKIHIQIGTLHGGIMSQGDSVVQNNNIQDSTFQGGVAGRDITGDVINIGTQPTNEDIEEILEIIKLLREEIPNLDQNNQGVALSSLESIEEEVKKPTKTEQLKILLFALWSIGKDVVNFANALTAIATRYEIKLPGTY